MHMVGYSEKKVRSSKKKSKIAHNIFLPKATYHKTIFLKSPCKMDIETYVTLLNLFKTKIIFFFHFSDPFLANFSTLPSTQTIKDIELKGYT